MERDVDPLTVGGRRAQVSVRGTHGLVVVWEDAVYLALHPRSPEWAIPPQVLRRGLLSSRGPRTASRWGN